MGDWMCVWVTLFFFLLSSVHLLHSFLMYLVIIWLFHLFQPFVCACVFGSPSAMVCVHGMCMIKFWCFMCYTSTIFMRMSRWDRGWEWVCTMCVCVYHLRYLSINNKMKRITRSFELVDKMCVRAVVFSLVLFFVCVSLALSLSLVLSITFSVLLLFFSYLMFLFQNDPLCEWANETTMKTVKNGIYMK